MSLSFIIVMLPDIGVGLLIGYGFLMLAYLWLLNCCHDLHQEEDRVRVCCIELADNHKPGEHQSCKVLQEAEHLLLDVCQLLQLHFNLGNLQHQS